MDTNERQGSLSRKVLLPVAAAAMAVVALAGVCIGMKLQDTPTQVDAAGGVGLTVDKNAGKFEAADSTQEETKGVTIPGWGSITIPAGATDITVDFYNPEANEGLYYLTFELRLPDDSEAGYEVLYASDLVEPGMHIQSITLSHSLSAGEYDAVIHVQPYRMDEEMTPTNNADMKTQIIAL